MNITSDWKPINGSSTEVYLFLANLRNLGKLMPEQVINWSAEEEHCSFTIKGMANLTLVIREKLPYTRIVLMPEGKSPFEFELIVHLREKNQLCDVMVDLDADLNPMLAMMAKRPLQNLVNTIVEKLSYEKF